MSNLRAMVCTATVLALLSAQQSFSQSQQPASDSGPTLRVTSTLVFLDVTVLDKKGRPVVTGLTKDDFSITEDKKPQSIFSFEAPEAHVSNANASDENPDGKAPVTILVLDLLNSKFEDFAFIRYSVRKYLMAQPNRLTSPAEMLVVGNESLEMIQGYTRSRADLLYALDHLPAALPIKEMNPSFYWERFVQSLDVLQQIALQNKGISGRKNIIWVGHGGPGIILNSFTFPGKAGEEVTQYVHSTANMLVDARVSLFVIYPGLPVGGSDMHVSALQADMTLGDNDPFAGDVNFGLFVNETGGKLFYNRNDVDAEIKQSEKIGSNYYTLTYQPQDVGSDGKFRRIRVILRNPNLHAVTKAGYFAPDKNERVDPRQQQMINLAEAVHSTIPFNALDVSLSNVLRHPDSRTAEFTVQLKSKNVNFVPTDDGHYAANLVVAAASLGGDRRILASRIKGVRVQTNTQDMTKLPEIVSRFQFTIQLPRKTKTVRLIIENEDAGRIGAAELDRKVIEAAPEAPTPQPQFAPIPPDHAPPAASHTQ
jgi:VWFA-related protein